ncbi:hypothetical protein ACEYYH_04490 [Microbacterium trichothecenolyticum]|uniref:hypothetical protein n=1 Tax=Microbacterium trichothecenolyticum TaxID=69370 RepID=UPI0035BE5E63
MAGDADGASRDGWALWFGGAAIGAIGLAWVVLGWIANGYPDGFSIVILCVGTPLWFIGAAKQRIARARANQLTPADDITS